MLQLVPDVEAMRDQVVYGNLRQLREISGADAATDPRDEIGTLMEVTTAWVVADPFRRAAATIDADELGFDLTSIDASVQAGAPPDEVAVFTGDIDADQVDDALRTFEPFADDLEQDEQDRVQLYRFGAEMKSDLARVTPARPLGVGGRFAVDGPTVWSVGADATLDAVAAVATGEGTSLADIDGFAEVAEVLDDSESYTAVMIGNPELLRFDPAALLGDRATPQMVEELTERFEENALAEWSVAGLGEGFVTGDPDDSELVIVLWHADDDAAEQNEDALAGVLDDGISAVTAELWSDICADADVARDGALVTASCTPRSPGLAVNIVLTRDVLLAWE